MAPPEMFVSPGPQTDLKGKTDRGASVRVNGQKVTVRSDGTFTHTVNLKEGVNLITVESKDPAGNTQYGKRVITYKGSKRSGATQTSGN